MQTPKQMWVEMHLMENQIHKLEKSEDQLTKTFMLI